MTSEQERVFMEILKEKDVFRLAIRGHAIIEKALDQTIAGAFRGNAPSELERLPFRTRLALFSAFTFLPPTHAKVITLLAGVRHDFAHGNIDELDAERTKVLRKEFRAAAPENMKEQFESDDPVVILSNGFILAWAAIDIASHAALAQREKERRALKFQTDLKSLLEKHETS